MEHKVILAMSRQFGSRGMEIGKKLAQQLDIPFFNKELIEMASKENGITQDLFEEVTEKQTKSFLYSLIMGSYTFGSRVSTLSDMSINDKLFLIQSNVIKKIAKSGSCIIMGRCADYILRDMPECVSVFISGDKRDKIKRVSEHYQIDEKTAEDMIVKTDKKRANYYNYYSSQEWGKAEYYDLCFNASVISEEDAISMIVQFASMKVERRITTC